MRVYAFAGAGFRLETRTIAAVKAGAARAKNMLADQPPMVVRAELLNRSIFSNQVCGSCSARFGLLRRPRLCAAVLFLATGLLPAETRAAIFFGVLLGVPLALARIPSPQHITANIRKALHIQPAICACTARVSGEAKPGLCRPLICE